MGIKKLFTFLNNNKLYKKYLYLNDLINENNLDKKKILVGVDANLFCYKYTYSYDNMLIGFFNQILNFLSNKIIPLYIFDGGTLSEKINTNYIRHKKKLISKIKLDELEQFIENNNYNNIEELLSIKKKLEKNSTKINNENIKILLELFDLLNIPYIFSHIEGEYLAVLLNKYNIINFFLTDDTDPIPAQINNTIKFYNNSVYYLETNLIYKNLNITKDEFCDFCILLGSDYAVFNHGLKPNELYKLIIKYKSIEIIIKNKIIDCLNEKSMEIIDKIRNIYYNSDSFERKMFIKNKYLFSNKNNNKLENCNNTINNEHNINLIIDHSNMLFYSNIILEYWDEFIEIISIDLNINNSNLIFVKSTEFKFNIYKYISKLKFNVKNIIKFIKNNINDITDNEINDIITSFEFLNTFGI